VQPHLLPPRAESPESAALRVPDDKDAGGPEMEGSHCDRTTRAATATPAWARSASDLALFKSNEPGTYELHAWARTADPFIGPPAGGQIPMPAQQRRRRHKNIPPEGQGNSRDSAASTTQSPSLRSGQCT
jgi:hypothetical protein